MVNRTQNQGNALSRVLYMKNDMIASKSTLNRRQSASHVRASYLSTGRGEGARKQRMITQRGPNWAAEQGFLVLKDDNRALISDNRALILDALVRVRCPTSLALPRIQAEPRNAERHQALAAVRKLVNVKLRGRQSIGRKVIGLKVNEGPTMYLRTYRNLNETTHQEPRRV